MDIQNLAQQFYEYSLYMRGYSKATVKRYKYVIEFYIKHFQIQKIDEVTESNVRELFFYGRTQRKWSTATFIVFYKSLSVFFKWCITKGCLEKNPIGDIEKPRLEKRLPAKLTKQDAFRLLEVIYNYPYNNKLLRVRNHAIFSVFLFAGLRLKELLHLRYSDVDLENLTLFINQGKGNKDRMVPISNTLVITLKRYLEERKYRNKTCPEFFTSLNLNSGFTVSGLKNLVVKIRQAAGINFTIHKLRHTFATLMLEGGCDIYSLSKMMGHSDIKTTTIYLAASAEHLRLQITKHPMNGL